MDAPRPKELSEAVGISPSYASMILSGDREPPRSLAIHIFRKTGWRHSKIADLTDEQMAMLEEIEPWSPSEGAKPRPLAATGGAEGIEPEKSAA